MLLFGLGADGKHHALQAVPNGDGTYSLNIGVTDLTIGVLDLPALGAVDDAEWSGTGDGTAIAILKAIYATQEENKDLLTAMAASLEEIVTNTSG